MHSDYNGCSRLDINTGRGQLYIPVLEYAGRVGNIWGGFIRYSTTRYVMTSVFLSYRLHSNTDSYLKFTMRARLRCTSATQLRRCTEIANVQCRFRGSALYSNGRRRHESSSQWKSQISLMSTDQVRRDTLKQYTRMNTSMN